MHYMTSVSHAKRREKCWNVFGKFGLKTNKKRALKYPSDVLY